MMIRRRKETGRLRFDLVAIFLVVSVFVVIAVLSLAAQSPEAAADEFMRALAKHDVDTLTEMSYLPDADPPLKEQWQTCVKRAKHYVFLWEYYGIKRISDDEASIRLAIMEFRGAQGGAEGEEVELPLIRHEGRWKVDLTSLSRRFFPALPR